MVDWVRRCVWAPRWRTAWSRAEGAAALGPAAVDVLLRGVDLLVQMSRLGEAELEAWQAEHGPEIARLEEELAAIQQGRRGRSVSSSLANPDVSFSQAVLDWRGRNVSFLDEQRVFAALRSIEQ
ncbi:MAG: hypothetical protein U0790_17440 [Isosphaeraceae bacterium]